MKTPREILLQRHKAIAPRLDAVRAVAMDQLNLKKTKEQRKAVAFFLRVLAALWRELILPSRRIWAGLAAAWVVIIIAHLACRETEPVIVAKSAPPSPEVLLALREQNELRAQLLRDGSRPADADRPKPVTLPHSELCVSWSLA